MRKRSHMHAGALKAYSHALVLHRQRVADARAKALAAGEEEGGAALPNGACHNGASLGANGTSNGSAGAGGGGARGAQGMQGIHVPARLLNNTAVLMHRWGDLMHVWGSTGGAI